jgi:hypothetical protein
LQKTVVILLFIVISGCSTLRKTGRSDRELRDDEISLLTTEDLINENLSRYNFFIQKAIIDYKSDDQSIRLLANIRFVVPDKYLISLRLTAGLEIVRIYIDADTILANDRINRTLYYGKPEFISSKYGIPFEIIPAIFGDFVQGNTNLGDNIECQDGMSQRDSYLKGMKLVYEIDCTKRKTMNVRQEASTNSQVNILYSEYQKINNVVTPLKIALSNVKTGLNISMNIERIEVPWNGTIDFSPGNNYEKVELK